MFKDFLFYLLPNSYCLFIADIDYRGMLCLPLQVDT